MTPKQRMLAARLSKKIKKNQQYAKSLGIEIVNKKTGEKI